MQNEVGQCEYGSSWVGVGPYWVVIGLGRGVLGLAWISSVVSQC